MTHLGYNALLLLFDLECLFDVGIGSFLVMGLLSEEFVGGGLDLLPHRLAECCVGARLILSLGTESIKSIAQFPT